MNNHANLITAPPNGNLLSSSNSSHHGIAAVKWNNTNVRRRDDVKEPRCRCIGNLAYSVDVKTMTASLPSSKKETDVVTMSCSSNEPQARNFTHPVSHGLIYDTTGMRCNKSKSTPQCFKIITVQTRSRVKVKAKITHHLRIRSPFSLNMYVYCFLYLSVFQNKKKRKLILSDTRNARSVRSTCNTVIIN